MSCSWHWPACCKWHTVHFLCYELHTRHWCTLSKVEACQNIALPASSLLRCADSDSVSSLKADSWLSSVRCLLPSVRQTLSCIVFRSGSSMKSVHHHGNVRLWLSCCHGTQSRTCTFPPFLKPVTPTTVAQVFRHQSPCVCYSVSLSHRS